MNKITWTGILIMATALTLFVADVVTDILSFLVPLVAAVGLIVFVAGLIMYAVNGMRGTRTATVTMPETHEENVRRAA
jgi:hypothetical protein